MRYCFVLFSPFSLHILLCVLSKFMKQIYDDDDDGVGKNRTCKQRTQIIVCSPTGTGGTKGAVGSVLHPVSGH